MLQPIYENEYEYTDDAGNEATIIQQTPMSYQNEYDDVTEEPVYYDYQVERDIEPKTNEDMRRCERKISRAS